MLPAFTKDNNGNPVYLGFPSESYNVDGSISYSHGKSYNIDKLAIVSSEDNFYMRVGENITDMTVENSMLCFGSIPYEILLKKGQQIYILKAKANITILATE